MERRSTRPVRTAHSLFAGSAVPFLLAVGPAPALALNEEVPLLEWLRTLPAARSRDDLTLVHASPGDVWRAPLPDAEDSELLATYGPCGTRMVVYGHIHLPYVRRLDELVVANSDSVGSPFDGDPRASYLLVDRGEPQIVRVEYDVEREVSLLLSSDYPDAVRLAETRRQGRFVPVDSAP